MSLPKRAMSRPKRRRNVGNPGDRIEGHIQFPEEWSIGRTVRGRSEVLVGGASLPCVIFEMKLHGGVGAFALHPTDARRLAGALLESAAKVEADYELSEVVQ